MGLWQCDSSNVAGPQLALLPGAFGGQTSPQDAEFESSGLPSDRLILSCGCKYEKPSTRIY